MPKLTKRYIESVKPDDKDIIVRDEGHDDAIKGFQCKVTPAGRRIYQYYYRTRDGRQRKPSIGEHGKITCDQARTIADQWREQKSKGGDPSLEKQTERKAVTLTQFYEKYMREYASHKKASSAREDQRLWELHILPSLGRYKLNSVTRQDIARLHQSMKDKPVAANRTLALLHKAFNLAREWGDSSLLLNPATGVKKYKEKARERFLGSAELVMLGDILRQCEADNDESASAILAIKLLILTGCRRNEVLALQWDWIDFEHGKIDFPDSKTGKKTVYLNPPAIELLQKVERIPNNPYVCVGKGNSGHLVNIQKAWNRIRIRTTIEIWKQDKTLDKLIQKIAPHSNNWPDRYRTLLAETKKHNLHTPKGLIDVRIHDLRHSFASVGAASGLSLLMIGKLLGHKESATTERYAHLLGDPMRAAAHQIGAHIAAVMDGQQAEVIPMKKETL